MNKWSVSIPGPLGTNLVQTGSFDCTKDHIPSIRFIEANLHSSPTVAFSYIMIDVERWYKYWESDPITFLPQDLYDLPDYRHDEIFSIVGRLRELELAICNSYEINSPTITQSYPGARLIIEDGRHRIYLIKKFGISAFPAAVPNNIIGELERSGLLYNIE